jgi:hypothetical protein
MGWLAAILELFWAVLDLVGVRHDWVKEEINSKPKNDVM